MKIHTARYLPILSIGFVIYALVSVVFQMHSNDWPSGDEYWHYSYSELVVTGQTTAS